MFIKKRKFSSYRPGVAQRVGRGIALLFHGCGTRRGWVVSSTPRPHFTLGKDPVPIAQEAGRAPGPVWTDGKSRPHRDSIPDRPSRSSVAIPTELPVHVSRQGNYDSVKLSIFSWKFVLFNWKQPSAEYLCEVRSTNSLFCGTHFTWRTREKRSRMLQTSVQVGYWSAVARM